MHQKANPSTENEWDGLRPQNVVQAAHADIERRRRNDERANDRNSKIYGDEYEQYAFLRTHVAKADGAFGLIADALAAVIDDREHPKELVKKLVVDRKGVTVEKYFDPSLKGKVRRSTKPYLKHLYNEQLLTAALEMEKAK